MSMKEKKLTIQKFTVYKITDIETGEIIYVGKTNNFKRRVDQHKYNGVISKYWNPTEMSVLNEYDTEEEAIIQEGRLIDELKPIFNKNRSGYVEVNNPDYQRQYRQTDKGKECIKEAQKRYFQSDKGKQAQREAIRRYQQSDNFKEHKLEYNREYYQNNRDGILEQKRRYHQSEKGKEVLREAQRRYYQRKKAERLAQLNNE